MPVPDTETLTTTAPEAAAPVAVKDATLDHLSIEKRVPFLKCVHVDVTFEKVGQDVAIPHTLRPSMPEQVRFEVVRQSAPGVVYQDLSASRLAWQASHIHLRASQPMVARLRLSLESPLEVATTPQSASGSLWTSVAHASGNFTADAGNWTVDSADQVTFAYTHLNPSAVLIALAIENSTTSSTPTNLYVTIPFTVGKTTAAGCWVLDNGNGEAGVIRAVAGETRLRILRAAPTAAWTASALTFVYGQIIVPL